jgi:anti-sigma factor RsiW
MFRDDTDHLAAALLEQRVRGELPGDQEPAVREHLGDCDRCRALYNRLMIAERLFQGGTRGITRLSKVELDRIATTVFSKRS